MPTTRVMGTHRLMTMLWRMKLSSSFRRALEVRVLQVLYKLKTNYQCLSGEHQVSMKTKLNLLKTVKLRKLSPKGRAVNRSKTLRKLLLTSLC